MLIVVLPKFYLRESGGPWGCYAARTTPSLFTALDKVDMASKRRTAEAAAQMQVATPPPQFGNCWNLKSWSTKNSWCKSGPPKMRHLLQQGGASHGIWHFALQLRGCADELTLGMRMRMISGMGRPGLASLVHLHPSTIEFVQPGGHVWIYVVPPFPTASHMVGECRIHPSPGGNSSACFQWPPGGSLVQVYVYIQYHVHIYIYIIHIMCI